MDAWNTIRSYSIDAERLLRRAVAAAKPAVYLERAALPYDAFFKAIPEAHVRFFENLATYHQTADCVCAHGGVDARTPGVQAQSRHNLLWGGGGFPERYTGLETVVYGHFDNAVLDATGWPGAAIQERTIGIDTISHGVLTAIRLPDRRIFQSRAIRGERGRGLSDPCPTRSPVRSRRAVARRGGESRPLFPCRSGRWPCSGIPRGPRGRARHVRGRSSWGTSSGFRSAALSR
jgi:hypothetical protein